MQDKDLKALISLLDDEDPEVSEHVWSKLSAMGVQGIDRLEAEWEEQEDPEIQSKIEELIQQIHVEQVTSELLAWRKGGGKSLLDGWILVTRFAFPDMDEQHYRNQVNRLVNTSWLQIANVGDHHEQLKKLNATLFGTERFKGNRKNPRFPHNYFLNYVLDQKTGNAISLGLLYLIIGQSLDFSLGGVILPGYFALYFNDGRHEFYIDPFNGGAFFSRTNLKEFLNKVGVAERGAFFKPTSNIYIILQLIRSLIADYRKLGREDKAAELEQLLRDIDIKFES